MNQNPQLHKIMSQVADLSMGRIFLTSIVLTVLYFFSMYNDGSAILAQIESMDQQINQEQSNKAETIKILKKEEQMRADVTMLVKKYEEVKSKIPIDFLETELRILVEEQALRYNLTTVKNQRGGRVKNFGSSEDAKLVEQVLLEYIFTGTFLDITRFIKAITTLEKVVALGDFSIVPSERTAREVRSSQMTFSVSLIGFRQAVVNEQENKDPKTTKGNKS